MNAVERISAIAKAKAFAVSMQKITGHEPKVTVYDDYVEVAWDEASRAGTIAYLDKTVQTAFGRLFSSTPTDAAPPDVQIRFGDVILPWSLRYVIPILLMAFAAGYATRSIRK